MLKLFYYYEGGLGDLFLQHKRHNHLAGLREFRRTTDCYVKIVLNVHNLQAAELFRHEQGVDEIETVVYDVGLRKPIHDSLANDDFIAAARYIPRTDGSSVFELSAEDRRYLDRELPRSPFILCHPGAGKKDFSLLDRMDFGRLFEESHRHSRDVVLVGGNSHRIVFENEYLTERFQGFHFRMLNLIGAANPRQVYEIARRSAAFVGSLSCYVWAAANHGKPGVCIAPDGHNDSYSELVSSSGMKLRRMSELNAPDLFAPLFEN